jgi:cell surface protein SprA
MEIPIGAFNVPQGSVVVTLQAEGILVEGIDYYSVNYQLGSSNLDASLGFKCAN